MAHHVEPMDIDSSVCDFDNKENSFHHNNLLPRTPCTEKGYEELDVSELNMKLRYSITPTASPMSKSYTASCLDNQNNETNMLDIENGNMSRSLYSTVPKNDTIVITQKSLPLQVLPTDHSQIGDGIRNVLQPLDSTTTADNITVTITKPIDIEDNLSLPSSSSSMVHTPEATTPTKEMQKIDGGSPIMRGLKSVLSMFRPSQSPIPPDDEFLKQSALSPPIVHSPESTDKAQSTCASTPLNVQKTKDPLGKSNSPTRDILVFNEDLEKELEWKDDSIIFGKEKVPIHKLFFQLPNQSASKTNPDLAKTLNKCKKLSENMNEMVEYMDISYNNTVVIDKTASNIPDMDATTESDCEFMDAESTIKSELEQSFSDVIGFQENSNVSNETLNASVFKSPDSFSASTEVETFIEKFTVTEEAIGQPDTVEVEIDSAKIIGKLDFIKSHDIVVPVINDVLNNNHNNTTVVEPVSADVIIDRTHNDEANLGETTQFGHIIQYQNITSGIDSTDTTKVLEVKIDINNTASDLTQVTMAAVDTNGVDYVNTTETIIQEPLPKEVTLDCKSLLDAKDCEIKNVAPPYMEIVEKRMNDEETQNITEEKVVALETNSSFSLVSQDQVAPLMNDVLNNDHNNITVVEPVPADVIIDRTQNDGAGVDETTDFGDIVQNQNITSEINSKDTTKSPEVKFDINNTASDLTQVPMAAVDTNGVDYVNKTETIVQEHLLKEVTLDCKSLIDAENCEIKNVAPPYMEIVEKRMIDEETQNITDKKVVASEINSSFTLVSQDKVAPHINDVLNNDHSNITVVEPVPADVIIDRTHNDDADVGKTTEFGDIVQNQNITNEINSTDTAKVPEVKVDINNTVSDLTQVPMAAVDTNGVDNVNKTEALVQEPLHKEVTLDCKSLIDAKDCEIKNVALPYMEIVEKRMIDEETQNITDEKVVASEINSSFTLVSQDQVAPLMNDVLNNDHNNITVVEPVPADVIIDRTHNDEADVGETTEFGDIVQNQNITSEINSTDTTKVPEVKVDIKNTVSENTQVTMAAVDTNGVDYVNTNEIIFQEPIPKEVTLDCKSLLGAKVCEIKDVAPPYMDKVEKHTIGEETQNITNKKVVASENNSSFALVSQDQVIAAIVLDPSAVACKVAASPPSSPAIVSKGYNFNFDEIEDPFATNAKVRLSPPPAQSPNRTFELNENRKNYLPSKINKNDRLKSQPERKQSVASNKKLKTSNAGKFKTPTKSEALHRLTVAETIESTAFQFEQKDEPTTEITESQIKDATNKTETAKENTITLNKEVTNESKEILPLEQSAYFSAVTSSSEGVEFKNTYSLPDFDHPDINPFATKSKVHQSPSREDTDLKPFTNRTKICQTPPPAHIEDPLCTMSNIISSIETSAHNIEMPIVNTNINIDFTQETAFSNMVKLDATIQIDPAEHLGFAENFSSTTTNTTNIEKNISIKTVNTEDEDTIEGPFLEAEEFNNENKMSEFDEDNVDMMQFSYLPNENDTNTEAGEMFIDADAFEFLLNQNQTNTVVDTGKESLFLKFDPLFAKRVSSDGVLSALNKVHKKQSTPKNTERTHLRRDMTFKKSPVPGPSSPKSLERIPLTKDATFDIFGPSTPQSLERTPLTKDVTSDISGPSTPKSLERIPLTKDATFDISGPSTPQSLERIPVTKDVTSDISGPSTPKTSERTQLSTGSTFDIPGLEVHNTMDDSCDDLNVTVSKPMMIVNPAMNAVVTPRNRSLTPGRSNRQSLTFTSPAIAVIDRLLSMSSANNSFMNHDTTIADVHRDNEADLALTHLRELLADKEISVYNLRTETKDLQNRLATMESQMKNLETIGEHRLKKINELNEKLDEKIKLNKSMANVVEEYERTIASLIAETEQNKILHVTEREQLIKERDEQAAHLASMEISFNDLHSKYEKSKQVILGFKANEDLYKESIKEFEENLTKMQKNYELLKQHATSKLNYANEELQKINRAHESEVVKLNALIKRKELHITSLEETLQQKTKANEELTAICDELINKVG